MEPARKGRQMETAAASGADDAGAKETGAHDALVELLTRLLGQPPRPRQLEMWQERLGKVSSPARLVESLMRWPPVAEQKFIRTHSPSGHFYSPVVDPEAVREYVRLNREAGLAGGLAGIDFSLERMEAFWQRNRDFIAATPFSETPQSGLRYSFRAGPYNHGDGTTLRAVINDRRPKRIIEIGSGYTTACMLDTADELQLEDFRLTCIEPYADRLRSVLRDEDRDRVTIVEEGVQGQPLEQFAALEAGDILFIDSSHVLKTGSDVHYELFYILPILKPGVLVHFHDCRFPLEYRDQLIFEKGHSWNEAYAVRAFLMYNTRFRVFFSGSCFAEARSKLVRDTFPAFLVNPGSALWLEVMDDGAPHGLGAVGGVSGFPEAIPKPNADS